MLQNKRVKYSFKIKFFKTSCQSILCYAAQVWGYEEIEKVEEIARFFIKRLSNLPINTPTHMIFSECVITPIYLFNLQLHFSYIMKTMNMSDSRLPKLITKYLIMKKVVLSKAG